MLTDKSYGIIIKLEFSRGGKTVLTPLPLLPNFRRKEPTMSENKNQLILLEDLGMIYTTEKSKVKRRFGIYKCGYCGTEFKANSFSTQNGNTNSCGCLQRKRASMAHITHGLAKNKIYGSWTAMHQRVFATTGKAYEYYGARGITICARWFYVKNFIEDMYPSYKEGLSIDRIDVNKNYEPSNCRGATKETQSRNTRKIHKTNTSGFRGVSFYKRDKIYTAQIRVNLKNKHLGRFKTALEAAKAYDSYVIENNLEHTINNV